MSSTVAYPDDIKACHRLLRERDGIIGERDEVIAECRTTIASKDALVEQQNRQLEAQKAALAKAIAERNLALQRAFRKRSEKYLDDPKQFVLDFGNTPDVIDAAEGIADAAEEQQVAGYTRRPKKDRKTRNEQLPAHLTRYEVTLDVPEDQKVCPDHGDRAIIGYDRIETLEIIPISLQARVTLVPKLACSKSPECGVVESPRPAGLVEGNRYDTSIAAEIAVAKYNGEWLLADGPVAFNLDGWIVYEGSAPYLGTLTREGFTVTACTCSDLYSAVPVMPAP